MKFIILLSIFFTWILCAHAIDTPVSESIGSYTAGCIRNSSELESEGNGFQVIRPSRGRYYGNSEMITFIESLSESVSTKLNGLLLIADISQQTGGPIPDDHSSHQTGLDADILLWQHPIAKQRTLTNTEREYIHPQSVLTQDETAVDEFKWDDINADILRLASLDPKVDRIFINPVIKKKLCREYPDAKWLSKLRPWYGHDGHFHVRLKCPEVNYLCESQNPIDTSGNGCGSDLASWFGADGRIKAKSKSGPSVQKKLPPECMSIVYGQH
jgi:penicillin-insensitive murein endopeptidase